VPAFTAATAARTQKTLLSRQQQQQQQQGLSKPIRRQQHAPSKTGGQQLQAYGPHTQPAAPAGHQQLLLLNPQLVPSPLLMLQQTHKQRTLQRLRQKHKQRRS
jgi:hypothetical protein